MSTHLKPEIPAAGIPPAVPSRLRRWRDGWRDRRLSRLPDRAFCRRVSLEGWEHLAAAREAGRGLLIAVRGGLPRTAERALRLFALARPAADLAPAALAEALAAGAVLFAAAGSPAADLEAAAEALAGGARLTIRRAPSP